MREERFTGKASAMKAAEYQVWNRAMAEFFYGPAFANQPVYLQVDADTLREIGFRIGIESDQAEQSFVAAVQSKLYLRKANPFGGFLGDAEDWRKQVKADPKLPPPFLGLLGACVLAASRMASDPALEIRQSNYYIRLNEILGLDHRVMPPCFEKVTNLWRELNRWLERNNGALGSPTAQYHARFSNIGYPISQCLLSKADRDKLSDFFLWEELSPEDDITLEELIPSLKVWVTRTRCKLTERGKALFNSDNGGSLTRQAAEIVAAELKSWDGRSMDTEGRLHAKIELNVEISHGGHRLQCALFPRAPERFPEGVYEAGAENVYLNYLEEDFPWFDPLPDEFLDRALAHGLILQREGYVLRFTSAPVIPLTEYNELGDWLSCSRVVAGEKHLVLCRQDYREQVEKHLTEHAKPGWAPPAPGSRGLPSGWLCFRNVQITTTSVDGVPEDLECLVPRLRVGIRLTGGLKMGRGVWFKGGEPKALITTQEDKPVVVHVDGERVEVLLKGSGEVNLGRLDLEPGEHEVSAGGQRKRFELRKSNSHTNGALKRELVGHVLRRNNDTFVPVSLSQSTLPQDEQPGQLSVFGARVLGSPQDVPAPLIEALTLPSGYKRYIVLGRRPGEIVEHNFESEIPPWLLEQSGSLRDKFELPMAFEPQWLIAIGSKRRESLRRIGLQPPEATIADERRVDDWIRWAKKRYRSLKGRHKRLMWEQYRGVAEALYLQVENEGDEL